MYDAFISYSQKQNRALAKALRNVLVRVGSKWHQRRSIEVWLDQTSLSASPTLWPSIEAKLIKSRYLILLASRASGQSKWVDKECATFLAAPGCGIDKVLIALTEGELRWDDQLKVFAGEPSVLPPSLASRFAQEPLWVDLRRFAESVNAPSKRDRDFLSSAIDLAATVQGRRKEDLFSEELLQQRRNVRLAASGVGALSLLAVGLVVAAGSAWQSRQTAVLERDQALRTQSLSLADVASRRLAAGDPVSAQLIALEGLADPDSSDSSARSRPYVARAEFAVRVANNQATERWITSIGPNYGWLTEMAPDGQTVLVRIETSLPQTANPTPPIFALIDSATGQPTARLDKTRALGNGLYINADSVLTVSDTASIWSVPAGKLIRSFATPGGEDGTRPSLDAERQLLLGGGGNGNLMVWAVEDGRPVAELRGHTKRVAFAAFAAGGRVVSVGYDGMIRLWSARTGATVGQLRDDGMVADASVISPNGKRLAIVRGDRSVAVWDIERSDPPRVMKGLKADRGPVAFSPDGKMLVASAADRRVIVWDTATGAEIRALGPFAMDIGDIAFAADGKRMMTLQSQLVSEQRPAEMTLWSVPDFAPIRKFGGNGGAGQFKISPSGEYFLALGGSTILRAEMARSFDHLAAPGVTAIAFLPDDRTVAIGSKDGTIETWDTVEARRMRMFGKIEPAVGAIAASLDGARIAATNERGDVRVYDVKTGVAQLTHKVAREPGNPVTGVGLGPAGETLYVAFSAGNVQAIEVASGKILANAPPKSDAANYRITAHPSGREIMISGRGHFDYLRRLDATTLREIAAVSEPALVGAYDAKGERLVTVTGAGVEIRSADGALLKALRDETGQLYPFALSFTRGGEDVFLIRQGAKAVIVNIQSGDIVDEIKLPTDHWQMAAINRAGTTVAFGCDDHLCLWRRAPDLAALVSSVRRGTPRCLSEDERASARLPDGPPSWCITEKKWPNDSTSWQTWQSFRELGIVIRPPYVRRAIVGLELANSPPRVAAVVKNGAAERANAMVGDIIVAIGSVPIATLDEALLVFGQAMPDQQLQVRVRRASSELVLKLAPESIAASTRRQLR